MASRKRKDKRRNRARQSYRYRFVTIDLRWVVVVLATAAHMGCVYYSLMHCTIVQSRSRARTSTLCGTSKRAVVTIHV